MAHFTWLRKSAPGPRRTATHQWRTALLLQRLEDRLTPSSWFTFAGNPQHTGDSTVPAQPADVIHWQTPVDLAPSGASVHYGSPVFTPANTVIVPIKTGSSGGFEVAARNGTTGNLLWTLPTDYTLPPHSWLPPYGPSLTSTGRLYFPGNGGTLYYVNNPDTPGATVNGQLAFYGIGNYLNNPAGYNSTVFIDTPITADNNGNVYFGFMVTGTNPSGLAGGGVARIDAAGNGSYVLAATAAGSSSVSRVPLSAAPVLSNDGTTLYAVLNNTSQYGGYLVGLDSTTLATRFQVALQDPRNNNPAGLIDQSTATPFVAPDNTVFISIFGNPYNGSRGFLLHFSADLSTEFVPGAFGWDDTQSIVPASAVPSYTGTSPFLIFSKYNNYVAAEVGSTGGDGVNKVALLDPYASQPDPNNDGTPVIPVMREVLTQVGPTPDAEFINSGYPNAVREWCINDTAIDPFTKSALINSEDGNLYRWDFTSNTLAQVVNITPGIGEPYTPTSIGPDGTIYAINGGTLTAIGGLNNYALTDISSPNPAAVGQTVTFTATLASTNGGPTPTGSIAFQEGPSTLAVVPVVNGQAVYSTSFATVGAHFITAAYSSDSTYAAGSTTLVESIQSFTTTLALSSGNLVVTDAVGGGMDDNLTVQADTLNSRYVFSDSLSIFAIVGSVPGAVVSADGHTATVPFATVTGSQVQIDTLGGNDVVAIDNSLGSFAVPGKTIAYDGGTGTNGLTIANGTFTQTIYDFTGPHSGDVQLGSALGTTTIDYLSANTVTNAGTETDVVFNLPAAAGASLEDNGTASDGVSQLRSPNAAFALTAFTNPTNTLTVNGAGADTVQLAAMDSGFAPVGETFAGVATDTFRFTAAGAVPNTATVTLTTATLDLNGSAPTINGLNGNGTVTSGVAGPSTLTVGSGNFSGTIQNGSGTVGLTKTGSGTQTLSGTNTWTGATTINGGILTLNGSLSGGPNPAPVTLNTAGVTLNGIGSIAGRAVVIATSTATSPSTVSGLTITNAGGTAVTVQAGALAAVVSAAMNNSAIGLLVSSGGSAKVLSATANGDNLGILVDGGTALIQGSNLDNDTAGGNAAGLQAQNGAVVDAGQSGAAAAYYGNVTGLGSSSGGNSFAGYSVYAPAMPDCPPGISDLSVPQAIRDLNTGGAFSNAGPQASSFDLPAQNNTWGTAITLNDIEKRVYHDLDNNSLGFVAYGTASATAAHLVNENGGLIRYYAVNPTSSSVNQALNPASTDTSGQKSLLRFVQLTFDSFVFLPGEAAGAFVLTQLNRPNHSTGQTTNAPVTLTLASAAYDPCDNGGNGAYRLTFQFGGAGGVVDAGSGTGPNYGGGSLADGNYQFDMTASDIQGGGPGGSALANPTSSTFWRRFGDVVTGTTTPTANDGDRFVNGADLTVMQGALRSRLGMANFRYDLDFNGNTTIDTSDYHTFLKRYGTFMDSSGNVRKV